MDNYLLSLLHPSWTHDGRWTGTSYLYYIHCGHMMGIWRGASYLNYFIPGHIMGRWRGTSFSTTSVMDKWWVDGQVPLISTTSVMDTWWVDRQVPLSLLHQWWTHDGLMDSHLLSLLHQWLHPSWTHDGRWTTTSYLYYIHHGHMMVDGQLPLISTTPIMDTWW